MPLQVPQESVYFYEATPGWNALYMWFPTRELERMVREENVKESILVDFPDGLEIEIEPVDVARMEKLYGLRITRPVDSLLRAFEALKLHKKNRIPPWSYIERAWLEALADDLDGQLGEQTALWKPDDVPPPARARQQLDGKRRKRAGLIKDVVKQRSVRGLHDVQQATPLQADAFAQVQMTEGDEPHAGLARLQTRMLRKTRDR